MTSQSLSKHPWQTGGQENKQKWTGKGLRKGERDTGICSQTPLSHFLFFHLRLTASLWLHTPTPSAKPPPNSGGIMRRNPQFFHTLGVLTGLP